MFSKKIIRYFCYLLALLLVPLALWCLLWFVASYTLTSAYCPEAREFVDALFASNPRCRQPAIAISLALALACLLGSVLAILVGRKFRTKIDSENAT